MKIYLVLDRLGRFLFETPAFTAAEARREAKARDARAITVFRKTPHNAHHATGGRDIPLNTIGHAMVR